MGYSYREYNFLAPTEDFYISIEYNYRLLREGNCDKTKTHKGYQSAKRD
jgi:hypothetical protein